MSAPPTASEVGTTRLGFVRAAAQFARTPAAVVMLAIILAALIGPFFTRDPLMLDVSNPLSAPGGGLWFGTDQFGRDIFARVLHGARLDLGVGFGAAAIAVVVGMPLGAMAAFRGGLFDATLLRISESFQAFPTLLLALGIVAAVGPSVPILLFIIALVNIPVYLRLTRSAVAPIVNADFVLAARCASRRELAILATVLTLNQLADRVRHTS